MPTLDKLDAASLIRAMRKCDKIGHRLLWTERKKPRWETIRANLMCTAFRIQQRLLKLLEARA